MNLLSSINNKTSAGCRAAAAGFFRQIRPCGLLFSSSMMSSRVRISSIVGSLFGLCALTQVMPAAAQTNYYTTNGMEYAVIGSLAGDQVFPDAAISTNGGFVVWQDNATDGDGWGVSARRVDSTLSGSLSTFRVNVQGTNDQENARVALLKNGGAVFVWQGGREGFQHIFARFLTPINTFLTTTDLAVSTFGSASSFQINPAVAVLSNSNVVVVWSSFNQAGAYSLQDVYAKILSPTGGTVSNEFLVNQFTNYNQRTPAVTALNGGGFVVSWVSEQQRVITPIVGTNSTYYSSGSIPVPSVDIYARLYQSNGAAVGSEFLVNSSSPAANPSLAAASDGSFLVAWSGRDSVNLTNGWDVYARPYSGTGIGGSIVRLNTYLNNNQYAPRLSAIGQDYLAVWTSLGQDGSREGVYGQFIHSDGSLIGSEFRVNTTTVSQQIQPVVASDGANQFLTVWSSYAGGANSFDLFAQRYINVTAVLQPMSAPFVYAPFSLSNNVYQPQLQVSWPPLQGIAVSNYEVYVDGSATAAGIVSSNQWNLTKAAGLTTNSSHSFQVDYVRVDGKRSPLSPATSGKTWSGLNWGGIPYEWMAQYYGGYIGGNYFTTNWPAATKVVGSGGVTLANVFVSGGSPLDSKTWLQQSWSHTSEGVFLNWNTQPGGIYQVQISTNLASGGWRNLGSPRYAAGVSDSIYIGGSPVGYYRVTLLRQ